MQRFLHGYRPLSNFSPNEQDKIIASIPPTVIRKLAILDLYTFNSDRNSGNIFVSPETKQMKPIDHGLILSSHLEDPATFFWLEFRASNTPFSEEELKYISNLNWKEKERQILAVAPSFSRESLKVGLFCTEFLKKGAEAGLTAFEIGPFFIRQLISIEFPISAILYERIKESPDFEEILPSAIDKEIAEYCTLRTAIQKMIHSSRASSPRRNFMQRELRSCLLTKFFGQRKDSEESLPLLHQLIRKSRNRNIPAMRLIQSYITSFEQHWREAIILIEESEMTPLQKDILK